jgi:hypothetical protein
LGLCSNLFAIILSERKHPIASKQSAEDNIGGRTLAAILRRDEAAVRVSLALPWSDVQVEGQVNHLKMIKRPMYGRGQFDLLIIFSAEAIPMIKRKRAASKRKRASPK